MKFDNFIDSLKINKIEYLLSEPMKNHTSFKIGGNADIFVKVKNIEELSLTLEKAKEFCVPYFLLGKGSNLLVSDNGIEGAVISLLGLDEISVEGETLTCGAGAALSSVCRAALEKCLSGIEFAYGIPGSIGGAVYMNAGAYGGEIADVIVSAKAIDENGKIINIEKEDMKLGYRTTVFKDSAMTVVSATFKLTKGEKADISAAMDDYMNRRLSKQPLEFPSAGSVFKRPIGNYAGTLIEQCGLKGKQIGGAEVSVKHAGFIINKGGATCADVKALIAFIQQTVLNETGVSLEPEVILIGKGESL